MHEDHRVRTAGLGLKTHGVKTADAQRSLFLEPKVCDAVLAWFDGTSCALHDFCATVFDDTHFELDRWTHARARARTDTPKMKCLWEWDTNRDQKPLEPQSVSCKQG